MTIHPLHRTAGSADTDAPQGPGGRPVVPTTSRLRPLGLAEVRLTEGFWAERQAVNASATLDHIERWLEREGWLGNFDAAAHGGLPGARRGREFADSEVYKLLEAMAWELGREHDDALAARFDAIVRRVAAAQESDGYIGTNFGRPGQAPRYTDLEWGHELYCQGHLYQAAVARVRTGHPDDLLVDVARRSADHVCEVFAPGANPGICGHPEIEVALAELGRALDEPRYVAQAAELVERRGHGTLADIEFGRSYYQDDLPVRDAEVFRGHAVRANYLAAGALDVAVERGDTELLDAVAQQWSRTIARRTYITGGQGSHHQDEGFGDDFVLPPDRAYSETCAGIGSIMVGWRLLLQTADPQYADVVERTLFNVVATSPAHDGRSFYYANTLHQRVPGEPADQDTVNNRAESSLRAPWFEVSCCPPNVARTYASLATYVATVDDGGLQLHQYASAQIRTTLPDGAALAVDVETGYPHDGRVVVRVVEGPDRPWALTLRVPGWSDGATVRVHGEESVPAAPGTVVVERGFVAGDVVELDLDVRPRFVVADDRVDAVRGCVAVERGPEVWCLESIDLGPSADASGVELADFVVDPEVAPAEAAGRVVVVGHAVERGDDADGALGSAAWPYREAGARAGARAAGPVVAPLVPYHDWANRGPAAMRIWLPTG